MTKSFFFLPLSEIIVKTLEFVVPGERSGERLDVFLAESGLGLSRRKIRSIIDVGGVYINKKRVRIASREIMRGDKIRVEYHEESLKKAKSRTIQFQKKDILLDHPEVYALNKPAGMPAQATKDQSIMHVVACLESLLKSEGHTKFKGLSLVHRLDKETTGVILVAKSTAAMTFLTDGFRHRQVKKSYLAVCYGLPKDEEFTERAFLSPIDKKTGSVRVVKAGGRSAVTHFQVLAVNRKLGVSLILCLPETGRSHQIRVHLEKNGLPIVGDKRYGSLERRDLPPQLAELTTHHHFLHAWRLEFTPGLDAAALTVTAPIPDLMQRFIKDAGLNCSLV